jgi:two-component system, LytTR family, sensor kinase
MEKTINKAPKSLLENIWLQEIFFLVLLIVVNFSGQLFVEDGELKYSAFVFILLYSHAQVHKIFLFPILFFKKRTFLYIFLAVLLLGFFTAISFSVDKLYFCEFYAKYNQPCGDFMGSLSSNFMSLLMISPLYFLRQYYIREKEKQEATLLIKQLEINQLKEQLNPHFMFNTLNNLYGVSLEQPSRTPDIILQLSQLMRYNIETSKKEFVPLNDELTFLANYTAIEMERVSSRCEFSKEIAIPTNELKIAPMLLLPFVENAFIHSTATAEKCRIQLIIKLNRDNNGIEMQISNTIPTKKSMVKSTGTGLENAKLRLEKIYPKTHLLTIENTLNEFNVNLALTLI